MSGPFVSPRMKPRFALNSLRKIEDKIIICHYRLPIPDGLSFVVQASAIRNITKLEIEPLSTAIVSQQSNS